MTDSWHSYPSIYALGHRALSELLFDPVLVEEKVDGSQFSFGKFAVHGCGADRRCDCNLISAELRTRSRGKDQDINYPDKMFTQACETVKRLAPDLHEGWTYRGEYLQKPKHNVLAYSRVPAQHIIIFDINTGNERYLDYEAKAAEAARLGLEVAPCIYSGIMSNPNQFRCMLERESVLGGVQIEGVVIKNYARFGIDKKVLLGKYVSEAFKEVHRKEWKISNPTNGDILQTLIGSYKTQGRWNKAIQHLREQGQLTDSPADIGKLIHEAQCDIAKECSDEISQVLLRWALPKIQRGSIAGLPEYYKQQLLEKQFVTEHVAN